MSHRGHAHVIAKGGEMKRMMAELYGKATGYCRGKGGSLSLTASQIGIVGSNAIVAAGIPIAAGVGLSIKMRNADQVCACFFGDGASNQGAFHEGLNFAALWKLPTVFVCENNLYAVSVRASDSTSVKDIATRAVGYGMPGEVVDGMDVVGVYEAAKTAIERARAGLGPTLLECKTYRYEGHSRGDPSFGVYRSREEVEEWKKKDPIDKCRAKLMADGHFTVEKDEVMREQIIKMVDEAVKFAEESPAPEPKEALEDLWSPE
jgi:TPP-dependent pyruvate/acetoin dehydrogenase alpha subunit